MRALYEQQFEAVHTYIVETTLYTSYNRNASGQESSYQTQTKMTKQIVSDDPIMINVQNVKGNTDMPEGIF